LTSLHKSRLPHHSVLVFSVKPPGKVPYTPSDFEIVPPGLGIGKPSDRFISRKMTRRKDETLDILRSRRANGSARIIQNIHHSNIRGGRQNGRGSSTRKRQPISNQTPQRNVSKENTSLYYQNWDLEMWNDKMQNAENKNDWELASRYFHRMSEMKIVPSYRTYTHYISVLARRLEWERCFDVLHDMKSHKLTPQPLHYAAVIFAADGAKKFDQVKEIFHHLKQQGMSPKHVVEGLRVYFRDPIRKKRGIDISGEEYYETLLSHERWMLKQFLKKVKEREEVLEILAKDDHKARAILGVSKDLKKKLKKVKRFNITWG